MFHASSYFPLKTINFMPSCFNERKLIVSKSACLHFIKRIAEFKNKTYCLISKCFMRYSTFLLTFDLIQRTCLNSQKGKAIK